MKKHLQSLEICYKKHSHSWTHDLLLLGGFLAILYLAGLGSYPLFVPDEGRYTEIAREMLENRDFIIPHLNGVVFLDKPIMYYWLEVVAIKMFGLNEFALRFFPALTGIWGCLLAYISGRKLFSRTSGIISALSLATTTMYFGAAHYANLDLEVAVFISTSLIFFLLGINTHNSRHANAWIYTGYVFTGIAILTKGMIGIAFPFLIIGSWILLTGSRSALKKLHPFSGMLVTASVALPWHIAAQIANKDFFHFFFVVQQISRFLSTTNFNNVSPWWFYLPIILTGCLPWTLFICQMLIHQIRAAIKNRHNQPNEIYLLLWIGFVLIFFSIPHAKTIGYILPIFLPLFILGGNYVTEHWPKLIHKQAYTATLGLPGYQFILAVICFIAASYLQPNLKFWLISAGWGFLISSVLIYYCIKRKLLILFTIISLIAATNMCICLLNSAELINNKTQKPLAMRIKHQLSTNDEVVNFYQYFQDTSLYLERKVVIVANWNNNDIILHDNWLRELWYGKSFAATNKLLIDEHTFWKNWESNKKIYVFVKQANLYKFTQHKAPYYFLQQNHDVFLLSNHKY